MRIELTQLLHATTGGQMVRPKETDYTGTLTMLHTAVTSTGTDLRDAIGKGIEKLEASGQAAQETTKQAVVDELSRMRTNLREARDRLTAGGEMLNAEVHRAVAELRDEMREVREAVEALTPPGPAEPTAPFTADGSGTFVYEAPPPETTGSLTATAGPAPAAVAVVAQNTTPQSTATATVPEQRNGNDTGDANNPVVPVEEIQRAVREAMTEELATLRPALEKQSLASLTGVRDDVRAQLGGAVGVLRGQLEAAREESRAGLAALREEAAKWRAEAQQKAATEPEAVKVTEVHRALLREAARVSSATVLCHRDAWEFITAHAGRQPHFRAPAQVLDQGEERVRAALSGRSLIALLIALYSVRETAVEGDGDQELATALYERVQESLSDLSTVGRPVTITLDDRVPAEGGAPSGDPDVPGPAGADEPQAGPSRGTGEPDGVEGEKE
ncbi:hypothetical protein [Streptomyces sp. NPDC056061]|uniref:hypothetical protein n=1 Tax=Streptomyces sp. NPDC056061 TaxID=3345700 RepID=UPI0035E08507